jgi:quinol monooxygenase YgiN
MIVVLNRLTLSRPIDDELLVMLRDDFIPGARARVGFHSFELVRISDAEVVVIVHYEDAASMRAIGIEFATPWFDAHVRSYLGGQPNRSVGEVISRS